MKHKIYLDIQGRAIEIRIHCDYVYNTYLRWGFKVPSKLEETMDRLGILEDVRAYFAENKKKIQGSGE
jgi:hypothetical protein